MVMCRVCRVVWLLSCLSCRVVSGSRVVFVVSCCVPGRVSFFVVSCCFSGSRVVFCRVVFCPGSCVVFVVSCLFLVVCRVCRVVLRPGRESVCRVVLCQGRVSFCRVVCVFCLCVL